MMRAWLEQTLAKRYGWRDFRTVGTPRTEDIDFHDSLRARALLHSKGAIAAAATPTPPTTPRRPRPTRTRRTRRGGRGGGGGGRGVVGRVRGGGRVEEEVDSSSSRRREGGGAAGRGEEAEKRVEEDSVANGRLPARAALGVGVVRLGGLTRWRGRGVNGAGLGWLVIAPLQKTECSKDRNEGIR